MTTYYSKYLGVPKALLPGVGGKKILDYWWDIIKSRQLFSHVFNRFHWFGYAAAVDVMRDQLLILKNVPLLIC